MHKSHPLKLKHSLIFALLIFAGSSMAYSQCLVYNRIYNYSESGFKSHSGSYKGYVILGPKQAMQDGLNRCAYVTFNIYSDKTGKTFDSDINTPTDGTPSSNGLIIGLVKQGKDLKILATKKSAGEGSDWNPFDSEAFSGTASARSGYGYIARILSATYSAWFPNYYYYTDGGGPEIGISDSTEPVNVYRWTATETYTLNEKFTSDVAKNHFDLDQAVEYLSDQLKKAGYSQ